MTSRKNSKVEAHSPKYRKESPFPLLHPDSCVYGFKDLVTHHLSGPNCLTKIELNHQADGTQKGLPARCVSEMSVTGHRKGSPPMALLPSPCVHNSILESLFFCLKPSSGPHKRGCQQDKDGVSHGIFTTS